ncbi:hypothetical protein CsSME_00039127 [Camellia sinensis var. sinensis]
MREDDSNWFSKWEDELPSPDELMPLSQTLITPDLAIAFDIRNPNNTPQPPPPPPLQTPSSQPNSAEFDSASAELAELGAGSAGDEPARTLKRPRLVWTPQLHKRFVDAVAHLGIKNAVPKTIMQLMSVDGLTRENVASHLQKYRLYLKRMQGISAGGGGGGGGGTRQCRLIFSTRVDRIPSISCHLCLSPPCSTTTRWRQRRWLWVDIRSCRISIGIWGILGRSQMGNLSIRFWRGSRRVFIEWEHRCRVMRHRMWRIWNRGLCCFCSCVVLDG